MASAFVKANIAKKNDTKNDEEDSKQHYDLNGSLTIPLNQSKLFIINYLIISIRISSYG